MIAPKAKPVIYEELTWKDVDKLKKTMKMAVISAVAPEQPSVHLPPASHTINCSAAGKRISMRTRVPETIDKIGDLIGTTLIKFLITIVFVQKKSEGGKRTI